LILPWLLLVGVLSKGAANIDIYAYFGDPVYIYSLKDGINDGFLTPFKVKQISTTLDEYVFTSDDKLIEGEIEAGKRYDEADFNKIIEIKEREVHRVKLFMEQIDQKEKTIVFCATQLHALGFRRAWCPSPYSPRSGLSPVGPRFKRRLAEHLSKTEGRGQQE
jgi:type I site-specific restriction endonuclease